MRGEYLFPQGLFEVARVLEKIQLLQLLTKITSSRRISEARGRSDKSFGGTGKVTTRAG